jgi:hypothetical protein
LKVSIKKIKKASFSKYRNLGDSNPLPNKIPTLYSSLSERQFKTENLSKTIKKIKFKIKSANYESEWKFSLEKQIN